MKLKLVQYNTLTHKDEDVNLPISTNTLSDWKEKFNDQSPSHITYTIEEK